MAKSLSLLVANRLQSIFNLGTPKSHLYLEDEFRSPIKERGDFELEFIRDIFAAKDFDPAKC